MCRHAMAYAVLALSTFSVKAFAGAARKPSPQLLPKSTALGLNALSLGPRPGRGGDAAKVQSRQQATTLLCMAFENAASVLERTGKKVGPALSIPVMECPPLLGGCLPGCVASARSTRQIESLYRQSLSIFRLNRVDVSDDHRDRMRGARGERRAGSTRRSSRLTSPSSTSWLPSILPIRCTLNP